VTYPLLVKKETTEPAYDRKKYVKTILASQRLISLGKLAEEMGMNIWNTRKWLEDHDIPQKMIAAGFYSPIRNIADIV